MASRRRRRVVAAVVSVAVTGAEKVRLKSPVRRSRRRGAAGGGQDGASPGGQGEAEESCSYKTPKRTQSSRSRLPTFSSPANEADVQQEIFWDPNSPIAHKRGSERKKQVAGGCTVEISEIVNRIAPQNEKPASYEESLLRLWIGDDAIPCTPGIAKIRPRTKANGARGLQLKNREEELMKLAKQFDKNLTDSIQDQDASCHNILSEANMSIEHQHEGQVENQQLLGECSQSATSLPIAVVNENTGVVEHTVNSSQTSIDLDAEVALNAIFDCSTQKSSSQLSQGLSNCSPNNNSHENQSTLLKEEHTLKEIAGANGSVAEEMHQRPGTAPSLECMEPIPAEIAKVSSEQTIPRAFSCKREPGTSHNLDRVVSEDFDDWDADLLADDSFLMQITQNPELISTPENALPHTSNENNETKAKPIESNKPNGAPCVSFKANNNVPASCALQKQSNKAGNTKAVLLNNDCHLETNERHSISKSSQNKMADNSAVPRRPEYKSRLEGFTQLKCDTSTTFPAKSAASIPVYSDLYKPQTEKYRNGMPGVYHQSSTIPASTKPHNLKKVTTQGPPKQVDMPKKGVSSFADWNEPRFSDDVLDLFCESDSLWGTICDDDDDLLYQVCDDIEKKTLSQDVGEKNENTKSVAGSTCKSEVDPCLSVTKQGLSDFIQAQKNHTGRKTFSFGAPLTLLKNESSPNTSVKHSCAPLKNESINRKWCRSNSVSEGGLASGTDSATMTSICLSDNCVQWQNGFCNLSKIQNKSINQVSTEKLKYVFRKSNSSQALVLDQKSTNMGSFSGTHLGLGESKSAPNIPLPTPLQTIPKPTFKRHFSDCFAKSETAEQKSRKCSQEEIARKKQEALERRKFKMQALLKNTAPT